MLLCRTIKVPAVLALIVCGMGRDGSALGPAPGISAVSGDVALVAPPSSVRRQAFESNDAVRVFLEREFVAPSVEINARQPGVYNAYSDFVDTVVNPAGRIRSYFFHFDPEGTALRQLAGSVTFDRPILGVIGRSITLEQTDGPLGAVGTLYPTDRFDREPEFQGRGNYDYFEILGDQRTVAFRWEVTTDLDQIRVVTTVPEPLSAGLLGACSGAVLLWRRLVLARRRVGAVHPPSRRGAHGAFNGVRVRR